MGGLWSSLDLTGGLAASLQMMVKALNLATGLRMIDHRTVELHS